VVPGHDEELLRGEAEFGAQLVQEASGRGVLVRRRAVGDVAGENHGVEAIAVEFVAEIVGELAIPGGGFLSGAEVQIGEMEQGGGRERSTMSPGEEVGIDCFDRSIEEVSQDSTSCSASGETARRRRVW